MLRSRTVAIITIPLDFSLLSLSAVLIYCFLEQGISFFRIILKKHDAYLKYHCFETKATGHYCIIRKKMLLNKLLFQNEKQI